MQTKSEYQRTLLLTVLLFVVLIWMPRPAHGLDYAIGADLSFHVRQRWQCDARHNGL